MQGLHPQFNGAECLRMILAPTQVRTVGEAQMCIERMREVLNRRTSTDLFSHIGWPIEND